MAHVSCNHNLYDNPLLAEAKKDASDFKNYLNASGRLSPDIFHRFYKMGTIGCPHDIALNLAQEEIRISKEAFDKGGPSSIECRKRSASIGDYMAPYKAGLRAKQ